MTSKLPPRPSLDHLKHQARDLQRDHAERVPGTIDRVAAHLPNPADPLSLARAQTVIAREYGFASWQKLRDGVEQALDAIHRATQSERAGLPADAIARIVEAISTCDLARTRDWLDRHPSLAQVQVNRARGSNLLHVAAGVDPGADSSATDALLRIVDLLVERGVDLQGVVELGDEEGGLGPVWYCCRTGTREVLQHLLERGAEPSCGLFVATYQERLDLLRMLHAHGASLDVVADGETPLLHAVKNRRAASLRTLLELGADVMARDGIGATALHYAVRQYLDLELIQALIDAGASVDAESNRGRSPLDLAVEQGREEVVDAMRAHSAIAGAFPTVGAPNPVSQRVSSPASATPLLRVDPEELEASVAWYESLGFRVETLSVDDAFARLGLGRAALMLTARAEPSGRPRERLIYRCPPAVFSGVEHAAIELGLSASRAGVLVARDPCGFEVEWIRDVGATDVECVMELCEPDVGRAAGFYEELGFARLPSERGNAVELSLGASRLRLREVAAAGSTAASLQLWIAHPDFDVAYRRLRDRFDLGGPAVSHASVFFDVVDPAGYRVTLSTPATDV